MLPSTKEVESVYLAGGGIIDAMAKLPPTEIPRTLLIDSTTLDVEAAQNVSRLVHHAGGTMVDAPVSGGM
jgi:3-hydroxyisobutyrate dehydrogenase